MRSDEAQVAHYWRAGAGRLKDLAQIGRLRGGSVSTTTSWIFLLIKIAAPLALIASLALRWLYLRAVRRSMLRPVTQSAAWADDDSTPLPRAFGAWRRAQRRACGRHSPPRSVASGHHSPKSSRQSRSGAAPTTADHAVSMLSALACSAATMGSFADQRFTARVSIATRSAAFGAHSAWSTASGGGCVVIRRMRAARGHACATLARKPVWCCEPVDVPRV